MNQNWIFKLSPYSLPDSFLISCCSTSLLFPRESSQRTMDLVLRPSSVRWLTDANWFCGTRNFWFILNRVGSFFLALGSRWTSFVLISLPFSRWVSSQAQSLILAFCWFLRGTNEKLVFLAVWNKRLICWQDTTNWCTAGSMPCHPNNRMQLRTCRGGM